MIKQAAAPVLADGKLINFPGRALFQYLESHLFDPNLTVASWCRACRICKVTALYRVQTAIGTSLGRYLEAARRNGDAALGARWGRVAGERRGLSGGL